MKVKFRPVKFVEEQETTEEWQLDLLMMEYLFQGLKTLLSSDPVLQILKPKLIGKIQGPISAPATASNTLERINGFIQLVRDAGFVVRVLDAMKLLGCKQDQVIRACRSLYQGLIT